MRNTRTTWKTSARRQNTCEPYGTNPRNKTRTSSTATATNTYNPRQYTDCRKTLQARIGSYRTLNQQITGTTRITAFSPTAAAKWMKYVEQGAQIYKFNTQQFKTIWGTQWNEPTPTAAYRYLQDKFGAGIKAVTRGRGNTWLVAATPKVAARPFNNYTWK